MESSLRRIAGSGRGTTVRAFCRGSSPDSSRISAWDPLSWRPRQEAPQKSGASRAPGLPGLTSRLCNHFWHVWMRAVVPRHVDVAVGRAAHVAREVVTNILEFPAAVLAVKDRLGLEARACPGRARDHPGQSPSRRNSCTSAEGGNASPPQGRCRSRSLRAESSLDCPWA